MVSIELILSAGSLPPGTFVTRIRQPARQEGFPARRDPVPLGLRPDLTVVGGGSAGIETEGDQATGKFLAPEPRFLEPG